MSKTRRRKNAATSASKRQTDACRINSAALVGSASVVACSTSDCAPLRKPSFGSGEKILRYPAEKVTAHMNVSGTSVINRYRVFCILIRMVVHKQSATTESN